MPPRPKNPPTYNINLANSFPSATISTNYNPTHTLRHPSLTAGMNSLNYPNYQAEATTSLLPPSTVTSPIDSTNAFVCNPFLAKNHPSSAPSAQAAKGASSFGSRERKPSAMEKKFNSLKTIGNRKSPQFYSMRLNKCKRHQSMPNEPQKLLLINSKNKTGAPSYISGKHQQQPLYENLTDSIQIHESDEFNCEPEPERNSIYRSDSGISNSSYECVTPVPAPRTNPRNCQSAPVYMNLPNSTTYSSANGAGYHILGRFATSSGSGGGGKGRHKSYHMPNKHGNGKCSSGGGGVGGSGVGIADANASIQMATSTPDNGPLLNLEVC